MVCSAATNLLCDGALCCRGSATARVCVWICVRERLSLCVRVRACVLYAIRVWCVRARMCVCVSACARADVCVRARAGACECVLARVRVRVRVRVRTRSAGWLIEGMAAFHRWMQVDYGRCMLHPCIGYLYALRGTPLAVL